MCECVYSFPREVLEECYLFTPPAELMELSGSDRLQERCVECYRRRLVQTQEVKKKKKKEKKEVHLHAGEAAARLCDSNIGRRQTHGCGRASVRN